MRSRWLVKCWRSQGLGPEQGAALGLVIAALLGFALTNLWPALALPQRWLQQWSVPLFCYPLSISSIVDSGLMTVFFFQAGLEVKLQWLGGSLGDWRRRALPMFAAIGGVIMPALIYTGFNHGLPQAQAWTLPTATDIALAVGILALLGSGLAPAIRPLLLALAMMDDVIAAILATVLYGGQFSAISWLELAAAGACFGLAWRRPASVRRYLLVAGLLLWCGLASAAIEPALAGMLLGLCWPVAAASDRCRAERLQQQLQPWVGVLIMPSFAFIHASVELHGLHLNHPSAARLFAGVGFGFVIGKPLGIALATGLACRLGWAERPQGLSQLDILLLGMLAGIGLNMSLVLAELAFPNPAEQDLARCAILTSSVLASLFAMSLGWWLRGRAHRVANPA